VLLEVLNFDFFHFFCQQFCAVNGFVPLWKTTKSVNIIGIGGDLLVDQIAEAGVLGTVYYHPKKAMANIISFAALEDKNGKGCIQYVPSRDIIF